MLVSGGFNKVFNNIASSYIKVGYESINAIRFCLKLRGAYLTFYMIDINTVVCSFVKALIFLEIQRLK